MIHGHYMVPLLRRTKSPTIGEEVVHQLDVRPPREQHPLRVIADRHTRQENADTRFYEGPFFSFPFFCLTFSHSLFLSVDTATSLTPTIHSTSTGPNHNLPNSIQNSGFLIIPKPSVRRRTLRKRNIKRALRRRKKEKTGRINSPSNPILTERRT